MSRFAAATNAGALGAWKRRSRKSLPCQFITPNKKMRAVPAPAHSARRAQLGVIKEASFSGFSRLLFRVSSSPSRRQAAGGQALRARWLCDRACGGPTNSRSKHETQARPCLLLSCSAPSFLAGPLLRASAECKFTKPATSNHQGAQLGLGLGLAGWALHKPPAAASGAGQRPGPS